MVPMLLSLALLPSAEIDVANPVTGSLVFLQNSKKIVAEVTDSHITHVAMIVNEDDGCWLYEAEPPRVRRVRLSKFYQEMAEGNHDSDEPVRIWILSPNQPFSADQAGAMRQYLDEQLGRRYSIKNYVKGKPGDGVNCAELTAGMLHALGMFEFPDSHSYTPGRLMAAIIPKYSSAREAFVTLTEETIEEVENESWCAQRWNEFTSWWKWCKWSSKECWLWCR